MAIRKSRPVARALYLTRGQGEHELSFSPGEAILLLRRVDENWLEGELDGQVGIFPANRVRVEIGFPSLPRESDIARSGRPFGVALYTFAGDHQGDLSLEKGETVELLESVGGGWTLGKIEERTGIFPSSFVEVFQPLPTGSPTVAKPNPRPRPRISTEDSMKPKPRPRTRRRLTDPAVQVAGTPVAVSDARQPQSCPVPSHKENTVKPESPTKATPSQTTPSRRRASLPSLDQQKSSLHSSIQVERKMLKSAEILLKLTSIPEKQEKLAEAVASHERNIVNMKREMNEIEARRSHLVAHSAPPVPPPPRPPAVNTKQQQKAQRKKVLEEMVETEISYCRKMGLFCREVLPSFKQWPEIKWEDLFGNIEELSEVSNRLSVCLQKVCEEDSWTDEANVGSVLQSFAPQLLEVYRPYCRNHYRALQMLEKLTEDASKNEKVKELLQLGRSELQAWDPQSLLIKPIQRILQYPLLLEELIKVTPIDHPHHRFLVSALSSLNQVARDINEFKRRKDIVDRYTGAGRLERSDRSIVYSMRKKARRMQQNFTQLAGLRSATVDPIFDEEEQRLLAMESCLRSLQRNATSWKEETERVLACRKTLLEAMSLYSSCSAQVSLSQAYFESTSSAWKKHWKLMKEQFMEPLLQVFLLFRNPMLLVGKRRDKLLDYDSLRHDMERTAELERLQQLKEQCIMAKRTYEALNAQLLEDLPQFTARVARVAAHLLHVFLGLQSTWHQQVLDMVPSGTMLPSDTSFISAHGQALAAVCQQLSVLHIVPVSLSASFSRHRAAGESATPPVVLRRQQFSSSGAISLREVAALNRMSRSLDDIDKIDSAGELEDLHSAHNQKEMDRAQSASPPQDEQTLEAVYEFIAENPWELSVEGGEKVTVLRPHDSSGSKEWWLVRDEAGREGYVDFTYLGHPCEEDDDYTELD